MNASMVFRHVLIALWKAIIAETGSVAILLSR